MAAAAPAPPTPRELGMRMPAEWEPHGATWLAWPHHASDWPGKFGAIPWVFCEMARHLTRGERVRMLVKNALDERRASVALQRAKVDLTQVDFVRRVTNRSWTRDFVPLFVVPSSTRRRKGTARTQLGAVKFRFNGWARYSNHKHDEAAGQYIAGEFADHTWQPSAPSAGRQRRVVLEGGAIDVDGQGTLLATEQCLLSGKQARNPELARAGTEAVLGDFLAIDKVLWLGDGVAGDDTGGHIDDFARFVAPGRVVLASEANRRDANYRPLAEARERLQGARDARGRRVETVLLPMPAPIHFDKWRLPASYANFYIANQSVLVPTFNDPMDRRALGILAELFRAHEVVGIHCLDLVLGLGTLHCSTQQEPARGKLHRNATGKGKQRRKAGARKAA